MGDLSSFTGKKEDVAVNLSVSTKTAYMNATYILQGNED